MARNKDAIKHNFDIIFLISREQGNDGGVGSVQAYVVDVDLDRNLREYCRKQCSCEVAK
jgi:hypothetical protein